MPDQHPASELHSFRELNQLTLMGYLVVSDMDPQWHGWGQVSRLLLCAREGRGHTIYTEVDQVTWVTSRDPGYGRISVLSQFPLHTASGSICRSKTSLQLKQNRPENCWRHHSECIPCDFLLTSGRACIDLVNTASEIWKIQKSPMDHFLSNSTPQERLRIHVCSPRCYEAVTSSQLCNKRESHFSSIKACVCRFWCHMCRYVWCQKSGQPLKVNVFVGVSALPWPGTQKVLS